MGKAAGGKWTEEKLEAERRRLEAMRVYEHEYASYTAICGIDEAGRGPLAGPVAAGAVILPKDCEILYLNDSKKLSEKRREELFTEIQEKAVTWNVGIVGPDVIDRINILQATYEAMRRAVEGLSVKPDLLLNDAVVIPGLEIEQVKIIKGDAKSVSIAAASILAKVARDHMMAEYDKLYPEYGFAKHKGYGTAAHIAAIRGLGPCPIHRKSFIGNFIENQEGPGRPGRNKRQLGKTYEQLAAGYLKSHGMVVLEQNYRSKNGEIDLVGKDGRYLVFVEVKYRQDARSGDPAEAVTAHKRQRIRQTARYYLYSHQYGEDTPCRFDVVSILGDETRWIKDAF